MGCLGAELGPLAKLVGGRRGGGEPEGYDPEEGRDEA